MLPVDQGGAGCNKETRASTVSAPLYSAKDQQSKDISGQSTIATQVKSFLHAGRIANFYDDWRQISNNQKILSWINNGFKIPFLIKPQQNHIPACNLLTDNSQEIQLEIDKLLLLGAIRPCQPIPGQFLSKVFSYP